jgi:hypothetical protein
VTYQMNNMNYRQQSVNLAGWAKPLQQVPFTQTLPLDKSLSSKCTVLRPPKLLPQRLSRFVKCLP